MYWLIAASSISYWAGVSCSERVNSMSRSCSAAGGLVDGAPDPGGAALERC